MQDVIFALGQCKVEVTQRAFLDEIHDHKAAALRRAKSVLDIRDFLLDVEGRGVDRVGQDDQHAHRTRHGAVGQAIVDHGDVAKPTAHQPAALRDDELFAVVERGWLRNRWLRDVPMIDDRLPNRTMPRPMGVLVVLSDPVDTAPLNVEQEVAYIKNALGAAERRGLVIVDFVEESTLRNLDLALAEREYHILHYSGRGLSTGRGSCLIMEDDEGKAVAAYA